MKRITITILIVSLLMLVSMISSCSKQDTSANETKVEIPVEVEQVKLGSVTREFNYTGNIVAEQEVKIFSKVQDRILKFEKDEGDYVRKGEVLVRIEGTQLEQTVIQAKAALVSANAQLANLEAEFERAKRLFDEEAMSQQQFDAIKTQYEATQALAKQAESSLKQATTRLADASIESPIAGIVGIRNYDQGDMATGPLPLLTIVQMEQVKVEVNVPEQDLGQLKPGLCADLKVLSYPDNEFKGVIDKIRPVLDPISRMGKVEILVDNRDYRLKPGMFAAVSICINTIENVLIIPKYAIIEKTELQRVDGIEETVVNSQVFVEENGLARLKDIKVGYKNGVVAVVDSGLNVGENLVVVGQQSLKDSTAVKVLNNTL
ncbi:efflux RND transporter periplasmic adaptor subunit [candidate division KSB1 bacterium]|nr:efflux RND transporter periplasmic adaptor subunit [candidate division KSB1 bacterium]